MTLAPIAIPLLLIALAVGMLMKADGMQMKADTLVHLPTLPMTPYGGDWDGK